MCGARLGGIGDWVEHVCPALVRNVPAPMPRRRPKSRAQGTPVHDQHPAASRVRPLSEPPTRTFEQLLTAEDRAWMRNIEKAFSRR